MHVTAREREEFEQVNLAHAEVYKGHGNYEKGVGVKA